MDEGRWINVGRLSDLRDGQARAVRVGAARVALFRIGAELHAIDDACPHMGTSLAEGRLSRGRVSCRWHGWSFDLRTGRGGDGARPWACVRVWPVEVRGADVYVERPADPAAAPPADDLWVPWDDRFVKRSPDED
jgi:nitrite reductase (NADH) small subunit/3-phenylpropionate/trans-cinnamate dioxygenase ferredoxin subunit